MKVLRVFIGVIVVGMVFGQETPDSSDTRLEALKSFQFDRLLEKGYRLNSLLRGREFARPISLIPLELKYGTQYYAIPMLAGETGTSDFDKGSFYQRLGHQLDLDITKVNLSSLLFGSSWIDIMTGLNFWYSSIFAPPDLPASWGAYQFSPRIIAPGITNDIILQFFDPWYMHLQYTFGLSRAKFYRDGREHLDEPVAWGRSVAYTGGVRLLIDRGFDYRFALGLDINTRFTRFEKISDGNDIMPAGELNLRHVGLTLTISVFYGGQKTIGDAAKEKYYHRNYVRARDEFNQFLKAYPKHANSRRARKYIDDCTVKIPIQLMREGLSFDERNMRDKALERYFMARNTSVDSTLTGALNQRIGQIARSRIYEAELMLERGQERTALDIVTDVAAYYAPARNLLPRFRSRIEIRNAENALSVGLYDKALSHLVTAITIYPEHALEVNLIRQGIVANLVRDANSISSADELALALKMLETARELSGSLGEENDKVLSELRQHYDTMEESLLQSRIREKMNIERRAMDEARKPKLRTGMTIPEVQDYLGEPDSILEKSDQTGENQQLWSYPLKNGNTLFLTFRKFILVKIEER